MPSETGWNLPDSDEAFSSDVEPSRQTVDGQLLDVAERLETVDWREVPTLSTPEVAAFVARLERAREKL